MKTQYIAISITTFILAGCATLISGTSDRISFASNVDPVKVYLEGLYVGETPIKVEVEKKIGNGRSVRFEKEGYQTQQFNLRNRFDTVAILDISSIITSGGIDILSGAIMEYNPKYYHIEMIEDREQATKNKKKQIQFASFILINSDAIKENIASGGGEVLDALIKLVAGESSSYQFSKWLSDHSDSIIATQTPEKLLSKLRSSGLTP